MQEAFQRFWEVFGAFGSNDSWLIMLFLLGAFLIGFITAWLYWRRKWKAIKAQLDLRNNEYTELNTKYTAQTETLELKEADLTKAHLEIEELTARVKQLEVDKGNLHSQIYTLNQKYNDLTGEKDLLLEKEVKYLSQLEDNDNIILGLKTKNQNLAVSADQSNNALAELTELQNEFENLTHKANALEKENVELQMKLKNNLEVANKSNEDFDTLKSKITDLSEENAELKRRLAALMAELEEEKNKTPIITPPVLEVPTILEEDDNDFVEETKEEKAAKAQAEVKAALGSQIALASEADKDDLKLINGVGPFIEKKLNNLGIYTFEQISQFDSNLINKVTDAIQFFPGRIERDDWVGQAKILLGKKNDGSLAASLEQKHPSNPNDLKIVEGIGPKIEGLLKAGGITTWAELASTPVTKLQSILDAAGDRYRIHKPDSWPKQAGLAAAGKWDELENLQDFLVGGKNPTKK